MHIRCGEFKTTVLHLFAAVKSRTNGFGFEFNWQLVYCDPKASNPWKIQKDMLAMLKIIGFLIKIGNESSLDQTLKK